MCPIPVLVALWHTDRSRNNCLKPSSRVYRCVSIHATRIEQMKWECVRELMVSDHWWPFCKKIPRFKPKSQASPHAFTWSSGTYLMPTSHNVCTQASQMCLPTQNWVYTGKENSHSTFLEFSSPELVIGKWHWPSMLCKKQPQHMPLLGYKGTHYMLNPQSITTGVYNWSQG